VESFFGGGSCRMEEGRVGVHSMSVHSREGVVRSRGFWFAFSSAASTATFGSGAVCICGD
jgi:hypothetical protein